jgi:CelD/BcsL family acetyltransferase involved in cellulose biosynthesis
LVTTALNSFHDITTEWEDVLAQSPMNTLFLTPQWQEVWWKTFGDSQGMAGFYLKTDEGVTAIASLIQSGDTMSFLGNQDTFDYNDFMIRPGHEAVFFETLLRCMEERSCNSMQLVSLLESSPTLQHLPEIAASHGYSVAIEEEDVTSGVAIPDNWDEYLAGLSKKDRHELRRKFRRLESADSWRWYMLSDWEEVHPRLEDFISLMKQSRTDKAEYMTPLREQFFYSICQRMSELGLLRLLFLEMDSKTVAASLCFDYGSSRLLYNSGYDLEYSYYSVGLLLNALCVREAIDRGLDYFDFLRGPEAYKRDLGGQKRNLYQMVISRS